jgi:autotransporter translocation and assembly factor TamB
MANRFDKREPDGAEGAPVGRRRAGARRWAMRVALVVGVGALLVGALLLALELGWQDQRILSIALSLAERELGVEISATAIPGRLSRGMEVRDIRIGDPRHPFAEIDELRVRWNILSLVSRDHWIANSVEIEGWTLRLHRTADGRWIAVDDLLARLSSAEPSASPAPREIDRDLGLLVRNIRLGAGELVLTLDPGEARTQPTGHPDGRPLLARLQAEGEIQQLRIRPSEPPEADLANLRAWLVESDSGIPALDQDVSLTAELELTPGRLKSFTAELRAPGLLATAEAAGRFDRLDRVVLDLEAEDLAPLSGWLQTTHPLTGRVTARAELSGPPTALIGSLHAQVRNLAYEDLQARALDFDIDFADPIPVALEDPETMDAHVRLHAEGFDLHELDRDWLPPGEADIDLVGGLAAGTLDLERAQARMKGLTLDAKGQISRTQIDGLELELAVADVAPWLRLHAAAPPLSGPLRAHARLDGPVAKPVGRIALESEDLQLAGRDVGALDAKIVRGHSGPATLDLVFGRAAESPLRAHAEIDLEQEQVDFTASGEARDWALLVENAPAIRGHVRAKGRYAWTPLRPRFEIALQSSETEFETHPIGAIELEARNEADGSITVSHFEIDGATGYLGLEAPASIRLGADGQWSLADLHLRAARTRGASESGEIRLAATGTGSELESFESSVDGVPVAWLNELFPDRPPLAGQLKGSAHWQRTREPEWTVGQLDWTDPKIGAIGLDHVALRWKGTTQGIGFDVETGIAGRSPLSARGQIELPDREIGLSEMFARDHFQLDLELDEWDLATLEALSPSWVRRINGIVSGSIRIEHDASGLHFGGGARIAGGGFTIPLLRRRFSPAEAEIRLENDRIVIESARIGEADALAEFSGALDYSGSESPRLEATLRFDHFPLARSSATWMNLLGEIAFTGSVARPVARGALSVEDAKFGVAASDDPILKEIRIATRSSDGSLRESATEETPPLHSADVDIEISLPGSTRVRGQGANLFVEGDVRLVKKPFESWRIRGEARVVNGSYTFQGRRFDVRRGRLLFTGEENIDPVLDVEARLPVADIVAIIEISGRLSSPIIRLSSEPSRSDQDVLAYLLFGRPADEVSGTANSRFDAAAARLVAGVAEQELREVLGDAMPIDSIEIGANAEGGTSEIGFGKYFGRNIFFRYVHILGDEPADRVGIEYRLNDQFSVGSSVTTTGDAGLDLIFRHDF